MKKSKLYRFLAAIVRPLVHIFYRLEVRGLENIPADGRCIICPNHTSNIDPVLLIVTLRRQIYFMAKAELFKNTWKAKLEAGDPYYNPNFSLDISYELK